MSRPPWNQVSISFNGKTKSSFSDVDIDIALCLKFHCQFLLTNLISSAFSFIYQTQHHNRTMSKDDKHPDYLTNGMKSKEVLDEMKNSSIALFKKLGKKVQKEGFAVVTVEMGSVRRPEIVPVVDDKIVPWEKLSEQIHFFLASSSDGVAYQIPPPCKAFHQILANGITIPLLLIYPMDPILKL